MLSPELRLPEGGSSHVGPTVLDYVPSYPPLQNKGEKGVGGERERARDSREEGSQAVRERRRLARALKSASA